MIKAYQKILLPLLAFSLVGLLERSSSSHYVWQQSFSGWFLTLLQGEQETPTNQSSQAAFLGNFFENSAQKSSELCGQKATEPNFLIIGGGGSPKSNEIALEKNILYFQRTLKNMGLTNPSTSIFFANGNDGKPSIRYLDAQQQEQFKIPNIPNLNGPATLANLTGWIDKTSNNTGPQKPIFLYFTGHGIINQNNANNNALILWNDTPVTVRNFSRTLDKLPQDSHIVTMMAQCFSGSFANFIYQNGDSNKPLAKQTRCGFFATIKTLPSVGCTPEVNEADYKDYSSSFFAGLSGINRIGQVVDSADYNQDGRISYSEAHAFAKVDEKTPDLPISTSEAWLQEKANKRDLDEVFEIPIVKLQNIARPEQQYVIDSLVKLFEFNTQKSYLKNLENLRSEQLVTETQKAYKIRLLMELLNVRMEAKVRNSNDEQMINILERLIECESSSWK